MQRLLITCFSVLIVAGLLAPKSTAIAPFYKEFKGKYLDENENEEFVKTAKAAKCYVCHIGKKKKTRNEYGAQLDNLLDKKKDKKDKEKIRKALDTVAALPIDPKDEKSPTYGDLIANGQLPGGEPQKEDPKGDDEDDGENEDDDEDDEDEEEEEEAGA